MGKVPKLSFMWISFLSELEQRQIISFSEKKMLSAEFNNPAFSFNELSLDEKGILLKNIEDCLGKDINLLKSRVTELQDSSLVEKNALELTHTWLRVDVYADKHHRSIVALIHALMASYIKISKD